MAKRSHGGLPLTLLPGTLDFLRVMQNRKSKAMEKCLSIKSSKDCPHPMLHMETQSASLNHRSSVSKDPY